MLNQDIYDLAHINNVQLDEIAKILNITKRGLIKCLCKQLPEQLRINIIYIIFRLSPLLEEIEAEFLFDIYVGNLQIKKYKSNIYNVVDDDGTIVGRISSHSLKERGCINESA